MTFYTEDALIEQPAIALLGKLGWQTVNCFDETFDGDATHQQRTRICCCPRVDGGKAVVD